VDVRAMPTPVSVSVADLLRLTKPRLSALVIATTAGGLWLAPGKIELFRTLGTLLAVTVVVGAANALNCYLERDSDRLMARTRDRPLPAGRMPPQVALWFGLGLAALSLPALAYFANPLTGALGAVAFLSYVLVYTPMKRRSSAAMLVGGIPGALPPLMGWTAVTGRMDLGGLVLFAILFLWQIPHFIAIALFRKDEYAAAGIRVVTNERGDAYSRFYAVLYTVPLVAITVLPFSMGLAGGWYLGTAVVLGAVFLGMTLYGFIRELGRPWARQLFLVSLVYLSGLFVALALDATPRL
jgi:protoheme IX farnesyltransferase